MTSVTEHQQPSIHETAIVGAVTARTGGFPLASLALLVTAIAIALACADLERWREQYAFLTARGPGPLIIFFVAAGFFGALIGLVHLFLHGFTWRSFLIAR